MSSSLDMDEEVTDIPLSPTPTSSAPTTATAPITSNHTMNKNTNDSTAPTPTPTGTGPSSSNASGDASNHEEEEEDLNVHELLDELEEPTETDIAVKELKESTWKLTSAIRSVGCDIDQRLNITESARGIDANLGVTRTVSNTASSIGTLWNQLQISEKANSLVNNDVVKNASETMRGTLEHTGVKGVWEKETQRIRDLDQEHKISTTAVGTLSSGMNWLTGQLESRTGQQGREEGRD